MRRRRKFWVGVAGLLMILPTLAGCGLSGSSTCADYMQASQDEQEHVVSQLAGKYHKGEWATPLGFPGVAYYCASHPQVTLDQFFAAADDY